MPGKTQARARVYYRAGLGLNHGRIGMIVIPQRFGERLNPHLHLHCLVTDGLFDTNGTFHPLFYDMGKDIHVLRRIFEKQLLDLMVKHQRLSEHFCDEILTWQHTGFSVDGSVRVLKGHRSRLERLIR